MKNIFFLTLLLTAPTILACANKINPSKVIVFIDTNTSELEVATAEKAACARGERLVVVPENAKEYKKYQHAYLTASKKWELCSNDFSKSCDKERAAYDKSSSELAEFQYKQPPISNALQKKLETLRNEKAMIQSFAISGHDGGGHFSGLKGNISRAQLALLLSSFQDINQVKSLLLLGCYTGTKQETSEWKRIFPDAKLIAGYDQAAPLSDRPYGHEYIMSILTKEKELISQSNQKQLQNFVSTNLKEMNQLYSGVYLECSDGKNEKSYYYGSQLSRKFEPMELDACIKKEDKLKASLERVSKFQSGELEPPTDTQNGELRKLYNEVRALEHCREILGTSFNTNSLFNLLFYEGVKKNFVSYYKDDLEKASEILNGLTPEKIEENKKNLLQAAEAEVKLQKENLDLLMNSPDKFFANREAEYEKMKDEFQKMLEDPTYNSLKDLFPQIVQPYGVTLPPSIPPGQEENYAKLMTTFQKMTNFRGWLDYEKENQELAIPNREALLQIAEDNLKSTRSIVEDFKNNPVKIWVPTEENLKKYSRKELLENVHNIYKVMGSMDHTQKEAKALAWLSSATSLHLENFNNPFEWHEYTGQVKAPEYPVRLERFISNQAGGYGYGMGSGIGGGLVGGMGSGY